MANPIWTRFARQYYLAACGRGGGDPSSRRGRPLTPTPATHNCPILETLGALGRFGPLPPRRYANAGLQPEQAQSFLDSELAVA